MLDIKLRGAPFLHQKPKHWQTKPSKEFSFGSQEKRDIKSKGKQLVKDIQFACRHSDSKKKLFLIYRAGKKIPWVIDGDLPLPYEEACEEEKIKNKLINWKGTNIVFNMTKTKSNLVFVGGNQYHSYGNITSTSFSSNPIYSAGTKVVITLSPSVKTNYKFFVSKIYNVKSTKIYQREYIFSMTETDMYIGSYMQHLRLSPIVTDKLVECYKVCKEKKLPIVNEQWLPEQLKSAEFFL